MTVIVFPYSHEVKDSILFWAFYKLNFFQFPELYELLSLLYCKCIVVRNIFCHNFRFFKSSYFLLIDERFSVGSF